MSTIILFIIGCWGCLVIGFFAGSIRGGKMARKSGFVGKMLVKKDGDGILYTLELHEDPVEFQNMNQVIFKIEPLS